MNLSSHIVLWFSGAWFLDQIRKLSFCDGVLVALFLLCPAYFVAIAERFRCASFDRGSKFRRSSSEGFYLFLLSPSGGGVVVAGCFVLIWVVGWLLDGHEGRGGCLPITTRSKRTQIKPGFRVLQVNRECCLLKGIRLCAA